MTRIKDRTFSERGWWKPARGPEHPRAGETKLLCSRKEAGWNREINRPCNLGVVPGCGGFLCYYRQDEGS